MTRASHAVEFDGPRIRTARLQLTPWTTADAEAALGVFGDGEVTRWLAPAMARVPDLAAMRQLLDGWVSAGSAAEPPIGRWKVTERAGGRMVGAVSLLPLPPDDIDLEVGVQIAREWWGNGYAGEAGDAVAHYAFEAGVDEIFAVSRPANRRAAAAARRMGMDWVGQTGKYYGTRLDVFRLRRYDLDVPGGLAPPEEPTEIRPMHAEREPTMPATLPDRCGTYAIGGHAITRLGLGTAQMSESGVWSHPRDAAEAKRVLREAVDLGVNLIDVAESSGPFDYEELIAQSLSPFPDDLLLMIKGGLLRTPQGEWEPLPRPSFLRKQIETRLWYLKLDRIPLFQLHGFSPHAPIADQLGLLTELQREGKIGRIGLAEVTVAELREAREHADIATVQAEYNLVNRAADPLVDYAESVGIGFVPWLPLATGALAGEDGPVAETARRRGVSPAQIALAWLLNRSPALLPTPGTLSVRHLEENVAAAGIRLTAAEVAGLDRLVPRP